MAKENKKVITKNNWISSFTLIGEAVINDYTFKTDEKSEKSAYIYNSLNLGVDCGEKHGIVYAEMMGGYNSEKENVIYAHGKKEDGTDDSKQRIEIDWNDREDPEILETIGDLCFITVGLEKTDKGKTFYKKFLSEYDAIAYIKKHLESGTVINVKGRLQYSYYQDNVQVRKTIQSIVLSKVDDKAKYAARFTQSVLLSKDSASLKNIDKDKGVMYVDGRVLDYIKEINGVGISGQYPFPKQFEFEFPDITNGEQCKKIIDKVFKVKKGITQINFDGDFIEGGAIVTTTLDDVPDEIKELIELNIYTEEQAIAACSTNGKRERRMVLRKPSTKIMGTDDSKTTVLQIFPEKYTEDDLTLDISKTETVDENVEVDKTNTESVNTNDMSWLDSL